MRVRFAAVVLVAAIAIATVAVGCGARTTDGTGPAAAPKNSSGDGGTSSASATAPLSAKDAGGDEHLFAGSTAEATSLISSAVDKKQNEINTCIREFRTRRNIARARVAVSFGIDQEGKLLGVTTKGKEDAELKACVTDALKGAPFPRSHAGVITVTKTYEELIQ